MLISLLGLVGLAQQMPSQLTGCSTMKLDVHPRLPQCNTLRPPVLLQSFNNCTCAVKRRAARDGLTSVCPTPDRSPGVYPPFT